MRTRGGAGIIVYGARGGGAYKHGQGRVGQLQDRAVSWRRWRRLAQTFRTEERFQKPALRTRRRTAFNLVIDDGGTASNVTAARTVATLKLRGHARCLL